MPRRFFLEPNVIFVATDRNIEIVSIVTIITFQLHLSIVK
jgi:hypothetical protein